MSNETTLWAVQLPGRLYSLAMPNQIVAEALAKLCNDLTPPGLLKLREGKTEAQLVNYPPLESCYAIATATIGTEDNDWHAQVARDCEELVIGLGILPTSPTPHPDDLAVDRAAASMKAKLAAARAKGRCGWETCPPDQLQQMLLDNISKGDPVDVLNFAMMLFNLGAATTKPASATPTETSECWSVDQELFCYDSLGELLDDEDDIEPGVTVWRATAVRPAVDELFDVDDLIEQLADRAQDIGGEYAEDFPNVTADALEELKQLMAHWIAKHCDITFYRVEDVKPYVVTADDFDAAELPAEVGDQ